MTESTATLNALADHLRLTFNPRADDVDDLHHQVRPYRSVAWDDLGAPAKLAWLSHARAVLGVIREVEAESEAADDHPEHSECADGCGLAVTHVGACLDKPGGRQVCEHDEECDGCDGSGVILGMDTPEGIQRCDSCDVFGGDLEAAWALAKAFPGAVVKFIGTDDQEHEAPQLDAAGLVNIPDGLCIASGTNPWVVLADGLVVSAS